MPSPTNPTNNKTGPFFHCPNGHELKVLPGMELSQSVRMLHQLSVTDRWLTLADRWLTWIYSTRWKTIENTCFKSLQIDPVKMRRHRLVFLRNNLFAKKKRVPYSFTNKYLNPPRVWNLSPLTTKNRPRGWNLTPLEGLGTWYQELIQWLKGCFMHVI